MFSLCQDPNTPEGREPSEAPPIPRLKAHSPQELDQGTGAALCFFNPLFPGDLDPTKHEKFKKSFKVQVSTETSSPVSTCCVPSPSPNAARDAWPATPRDCLPDSQIAAAEVELGASGPSLSPLPSLQRWTAAPPAAQRMRVLQEALQPPHTWATQGSCSLCFSP